MGLPERVSNIDIAVWQDISPDDLGRTGGLYSQNRLEAGQALKYSRAGGQSYDEIAYRFSSCHSHGGKVGLASTLAERQSREDRDARWETSASITSELALLSHRLLDFRPANATRLGWEILDDDLFRIIELQGGEGRQELVFPLRHSPRIFDDMATNRDEPTCASLLLAGTELDAIWLPLSRLIELRRYPSFEEWHPPAGTRIQRDHYYCFISHRWLTAAHPDPNGRQARLLVWQLIHGLLEAIDVALERGLHTARRFAVPLGRPLGAYCSDLAESLIVNLLRTTCDDVDLHDLGEEAREILGRIELEDPVAGADGEDFGSLCDAIASSDGLSRFLDRIRLWIDYSCIPQGSDPAAGGDLVALALNRLAAVQVVGSTVIMLDDPFDYLTRAWCTLEASISDGIVGKSYLLVGSEGSTISRSKDRVSFDHLMQDRAHLIWRAILDTVLFEVQDGETCLRRLGLSATKAEDVGHVYRQLLSLDAPRKVHVDSSELITGALPVLPRARGETESSRDASVDIGVTARPPQSLNWQGAASLKSWPGHGSAGQYGSFGVIAGGQGGRACHVAVVGSCEGEAILAFAWMLDHLGDLVEALGVQVSSVSWLASDVSPVGEFADAGLLFVECRTDALVVVASEARLRHCDTTQWLLRSAGAAEIDVHVLILDQADDNLRTVGVATRAQAEDVDGSMRPEPRILASIDGGIFRGQLAMVLDAVVR